MIAALLQSRWNHAAKARCIYTEFMLQMRCNSVRGAIVILGTGQQFFIYDGSGPPLPEQITITIGNLMCLAQGHCMAPMGFKTVISKFGVKHPTTVLSHKCLMSSLEGFIENNISFGYLLLHIHLSVKTAFMAKKKQQKHKNPKKFK